MLLACYLVPQSANELMKMIGMNNDESEYVITNIFCDGMMMMIRRVRRTVLLKDIL